MTDPHRQAERIRLLIAEDQTLIREGLATLLSQQNDDFEIVGAAADGEQAIEFARRYRPDVILMDVRLPDGSGVEACREILSEQPTARVIFLTSYTDDDSVLAAVLAGAYGYVLKEIDSAALIRAIRTVSTGRSILDPAVTKRALEWIKTVPAGEGPARPSSLSPQEERVLALVADGLTNKEIANRLQIAEVTVKARLGKLYKKYGVNTRLQLLSTAMKHGLISSE